MWKKAFPNIKEKYFKSVNKAFLIYILYIQSWKEGLVESPSVVYKYIKYASDDRYSEIEILVALPKETRSLWVEFEMYWYMCTSPSNRQNCVPFVCLV